MAATLMSTPASHLRCDSPVTSRSSRTLFFLGIFLFILASKFWLIDHFGNGTPYWDQWDGEANGLFIPYLEQRLDWRFFFQPHNEHRIACTKILSLGLLKVNGQWDPRLEMSIQGVIHAATMALLVFLLSFKTSPGHSVGLGIFTAFICAVPVAWENTLWGFQSQFYFVVLWGISGLYFNWRYQTLSRWWLFGCALFAIGLVSMAGGMLAPAAATVLVVSRILTSPRSWPRQLGGAGILGLLCVTGFLLVQHVPGHDSLKAQSAAEMLSSLKSLAAWPLKSWLFAIILQAPFLALGFRAYRRKTTSNDLAWLLTALGTWSMLQMLAISYGRANGGLASRYTDNFSIGLCINAACGLYLLQISRGVFQK